MTDDSPMPWCLSCSVKMELWAPDNITMVSVCHHCWKKLNTVERCQIVASFRQSESMHHLAEVLMNGMRDAVTEHLLATQKRSWENSKN